MLINNTFILTPHTTPLQSSTAHDLLSNTNMRVGYVIMYVLGLGKGINFNDRLQRIQPSGFNDRASQSDYVGY